MTSESETLVRCLPIGICSWDFSYSSEKHSGIVTFAWGSERGSITINGRNYQIDKPSFFTGQWMMIENGETLLTAHKQSAFTRTFDLAGKAGAAELRAVSMWKGSMVLEGANVNCRIERDHPFTRRCSILGTWEDFRIVAFAFWLTVILHRRASSSNAGGA